MGNDKITFLEAFGWVMATQFIGFGLAGLCRRFLVKPKAMMWPSTFGSIALYVSLHKPDLPIGRWRMPRFTFFWIVLTVIFAYTWIPQFFAQFLQAVSILCFFSSNYANWLGSAQRGLGVLAFTFDWYYMFGSMLGNVLTIPFVYMANNIAGYILFDWILVPIFAHINPFGHPELTIPGDVNFDGTRFDNQVTSKLFNKTGNQIDAVSLYDSTTFDLDVGKFDDNKPIFITDMFALNYFSSFLVLTAMFSHIALWHGKQIVRQFRGKGSVLQRERGG